MLLVRDVYRVYASNRDFLTNNIGLCFQFLSSLNKATLIEASDIAKGRVYRMPRGWPELTVW